MILYTSCGVIFSCLFEELSYFVSTKYVSVFLLEVFIIWIGMLHFAVQFDEWNKQVYQFSLYHAWEQPLLLQSVPKGNKTSSIDNEMCPKVTAA